MLALVPHRPNGSVAHRDPCTILPVQESIPQHPKVVSAQYFSCPRNVREAVTISLHFRHFALNRLQGVGNGDWQIVLHEALGF